MQKLLENLAATAELMGQTISPIAISVMAEDLSEYPINIVIEALSILRKESKGRMTLASIIENINKLSPDGRPGSDEAWAMIPRDEITSVVMTNEMAEALSIARPLLDEGDQIGARMAFKESYNRIIESNKRNGIKPKWFPSLGFDNEGHLPALEQAVRLGRIEKSHALSLISPDQGRKLLECDKPVLSIVHKKLTDEEVKENILKMKELLSHSKFGVKHE